MNLRLFYTFGLSEVSTLRPPVVLQRILTLSIELVLPLDLCTSIANDVDRQLYDWPPTIQVNTVIVALYTGAGVLLNLSLYGYNIYISTI